MDVIFNYNHGGKSPSTRRVWIEMYGICAYQNFYWVTLHTEGVD